MKTFKNSQAGGSMIELLIASAIFCITSLGVLGLIASSIATNNRNKIDSTQTMLASAIMEQVTSTLIGSGESSLKDCADTIHVIETTVGGAELNADGDAIDFDESDPDAGHSMEYVVRTPCEPTGDIQAIYDVRWNISVIGAAEATPTNTFLIVVSAQKLGGGQGNMLASAPVTLRMMAGN